MPTLLSFDPALRHPAVVDYAGKSVHAGDGRPGSYRIGMEREQRFGAPIGGTAGLCFPVNAGGAATLTWHAQDDGTHAVNLTQDYITHPCTDDGAFSWFALEDTVQAGGGPFCRPDELRTTVNLLWDYRVQRGATVAARAFVGLGVIWDDHGAFVELDFNSHNWPASQPGDPDVQIVAHPPDGTSSPLMAKGWG